MSWDDDEDRERPEPGPEEEAFLATIAESPLDEAPHGVFADWLDDHDRPEEADWHRAWRAADARAAREWFEKFAASHTTEYGVNEREFTAGEIIGAGINVLGGGWGYLTQHGGTDLQDTMYDEWSRKEFLSKLALVTGRYINVEETQDGFQPFSCSC